MYTAYFIIEYKYWGFKHPVYLQVTIKDGVRYHPLEDSYVMELADERVQMEMNVYFQDVYNEAENCDVEVYLISAREYNVASNLFLKIVV